MARVKDAIATGKFMLLLGCCFDASAASSVTVTEDYPARLRASSTVQGLSAEDVFGDKVGLYTGALEFLQTDVVLPGIGDLDIVVSRKLTAGSQGANRLFADWDLAVPSAHGVFSEQGGWNSGLGGKSFNRCSKYAWPADELVKGSLPGQQEATVSFMSDEFWHGTFLYLPGTGEEELLSRQPDGRPQPNNGFNYPLTTKSGAAVRCISMNGGSQEGFEVLTPQGITYQLAFMVTRSVPALLKYQTVPGPGGLTTQFILRRADHRLFPISAKDRFGNTLSYQWDASTGHLTSISASDGRVVDFAYSGSRISQVRAAGQVWNYDYSSGVLTTVTLPDQSYWSFTPGLTMASEGTGIVPAVRGRCYSPGIPTNQTFGSMRHPGGAVATFTLTPTLHGRSYEYYSCSAQPNTAAYETTPETFPSRFYAWSLTKKVVSGVGLEAPYTWTYGYGPDNGCYVGGLPATDPLTCTPSSPTEKRVEVLEPTGVTVGYVFSNKADHSEGYLLRTERPGRVETSVHEFGDPGQFPLYAGTSIMPPAGRGWYMSRIVPLRERSIQQDGLKSIWRVNEYDVMARPTSITEFSTPSP